MINNIGDNNANGQFHYYKDVITPETNTRKFSWLVLIEEELKSSFATWNHQQ